MFPETVKNIQEDIEKKTLKRGLVRELRKHTVPGGAPQTEIVVDMHDYDVIIPEKECILFFKSYTLLSLVGEEIYFIITDVYPDEDMTFGSMLEADKRRKAPILKKLYDKQPLSGTIVKFVKAGAYLDLGNGVQGLLRNSDMFPKSGRLIEERFRKFMEIKVVYDHTTARGTLIFKPDLPVSDDGEIETFVKGQIYNGKISKVFPDKVFVTLRSGMDCLCAYPLALGRVEKNELVSVYITKVDGVKIRGKIMNRINGLN